MTVYCNGRLLADKVDIAETFGARLKGLMGRPCLAEGEGLLLKRCPGIHTFFMRMDIDAVFLSEDMTVLGVETLKPWNIGTSYKKTAHVLELGYAPPWVRTGAVLTMKG